jgi:hypothetical protein
MRRWSVSVPSRIWNAFIGASAAPVLRSMTVRARMM